MRELDGTIQVLQIAFGSALEREQLRVPRRLLERRLELLFRALRAADIQIDVRKIEPRWNVSRIQRNRLPEFRNGFAQHLGRSQASVRDPEQHVRLRVVHVGAQNRLQLADVVVQMWRGREQIRRNAIEALARVLGRSSVLRLRADGCCRGQDNQCASQHSAREIGHSHSKTRFAACPP